MFNEPRLTTHLTSSSSAEHRPSIRTLARRFARAALEGDVEKMDLLVKEGDALSERTLLAASNRSRAATSQASVVSEFAKRWRTSSEQKLSSDVAIRVGRKLVREELASVRNGKKSEGMSADRHQALTELFSLVDPELRASVHAYLVNDVSRFVMIERVSLIGGAEDEPRATDTAVINQLFDVEDSLCEFIRTAATNAAALTTSREADNSPQPCEPYDFDEESPSP